MFGLVCKLVWIVMFGLHVVWFVCVARNVTHDHGGDRD